MKENYTLFQVPFISTVQEMLLNSAKTYGNKLALEDLNATPIQRVTYNQLLENVLKFGSALKQLGLQERTHIAVIGENRVQWGVTYLTAMLFNYVIVPVDKNLSSNEILNILHESESEALVFSDSFETLFKEKRSTLKKLKHYISMDHLTEKEGIFSMVEMINKAPSFQVDQLPKINPNEMCEIIFTSGSLGRAKGVMLTQNNLAANLMAMTQMLFIAPEDRFLSVLPMHHTYECTCGFLCPIFSGASAHFARSLKTVVEDLQKVQATVLLAVPLLYDKMFKRIYKSINEDKVKSVIMPGLIKVTNVLEKVGWKSSKKKIFKELHAKFGGHVRMFIAGGAAPDPKVAKGLREFGFVFVQGYGLTETSPITALNRLDAFKDNAAGLPLPGVHIKINNPDAEGNGEVFIKGPNVMPGYYKNEKLTEDAFENGWFKSGDIGYLDKEGFLHISGRKKNVIIANNGKNVFPEEIEDYLNRSPYIMESLVYGEKDSKHDEVIAAKLVVDAEAFIEYSEKNNLPITEELIHKVVASEIKEINKELTSFKQIKKFTIRQKEFEKTTTQKIKRYLVDNDTLGE